jgi:hypothetical protein
MTSYEVVASAEFQELAQAILENDDLAELIAQEVANYERVHGAVAERTTATTDDDDK